MTLSEYADWISTANAVLRSMRDKGARWWGFCVSHTTFDLVVGEPLGKDNIVLCMPGCSYLAGPVQWPNQQLQIEIVKDYDVRVEDRSVGFHAESGLLRWRRNFDIWSYCGLWVGRSQKPEPSIPLESITESFRHIAARYYAGEIAYDELVVAVNSMLWYKMPAAGKQGATADPRAS